MPDPKATKLTMLPHKPEDRPRLFVAHLNSGDLGQSQRCTPPTPNSLRDPGKRSSAATRFVTC